MGFGESEIEDLGVAAFGDEEIRGLDVAMNDSFGMSSIEGVSDFDADIEQTFEFHRPIADAVLQGNALEKFHGDEGFVVVVADVVNGADVRMVQCGCGLGFALKAREDLRIAGDIFGQELQRHEAVQAAVFRLVDNAHTAAPELFNDAVMRDGFADHAVAVW